MCVRSCFGRSVAMAAPIVARAHEVRKNGEFLGFFEFLAWGALTETRVDILFGHHAVDIKDVFGHGLLYHCNQRLRVAAVRLTASGEWMNPVCQDGSLPCGVNHFVIGSAAAPATCHHPAAHHRTAKRAALAAGWVLQPTVADGNCGVDCFAHQLGLERNAATFAVLRTYLAAFMERISNVPAWQGAFVACQEVATSASVASAGGIGPPVGTPAAWAKSGSSSSSSASASSSLMQVPSSSAAVADQAQPVPQGTVPSTDTSDTIPDSSKAMSSDTIPPSDAIVLSSASTNSDAAPLSDTIQSPGAMSLVSLPAPPQSGPAERPVAFADWLRKLPKSKLDDDMSSVKAFKAIEEVWRVEHPRHRAATVRPSRKYNPSKLHHKLATGIQFLAWRKGDGSGSRAFLTDWQAIPAKSILTRGPFSTYVHRNVHDMLIDPAHTGGGGKGLSDTHRHLIC